MHNVGRNDPCPCGSGKKNKHCCGAKISANIPQSPNGRILAAQLLERAVLLHKTGQTSQAEALYQQVLQLDPQQPDALHLLGVIAAQAGNHGDAAKLIERAIKKHPLNPAFHNNLGNAYRYLEGFSQRRIACYQAAIKLDPGYAEAHNNLGNALKDKGELTAAVKSFHAALKYNPALTEASLGLGSALQRLDRHAEACEVLTKLLGRTPERLDARIGLGASLCTLGRLKESEACLLDALRLDKSSADAYFHLGLVLHAQERLEAAAESLSMAIKLKPAFPEAYYHLGLALQANMLQTAAEESFLRALEHKPDDPLARLGLAESMAELGKEDEAIHEYKKVIAKHPEWGLAHIKLAMVLRKKGNLATALTNLRTAQALGENTPTLLHMIAALEGQTPTAASERYISEVFDGYAATFDKHLVDGLKYDSPGHLLQLANQHWCLPDKAWRVLDLGCGTGLCGVAFGPQSKEMVGVDLSAKMLNKARERGIYQRLEHSELLAMLQAEPAASFDIVIAADVFVYIGDLSGIHAEVKRVLKPHGLFLYSVESSNALLTDDQRLPASDYKLLLSGRFAHAGDYLQRLATESNLQLLAMESRTLRMENNAPIEGWCVVLGA